MVTWITRFLTGWKEVTRAFEETLVDNISATIPWLAPIIPAYIAFVNLTEMLKFNNTIGWIGAIVVEFLGLATVSTTFWLWNYNDSNKGKDGNQKAPVFVSGFTAGFYILIVIIVNVVLDIDKSPFTHILAKALLSTLSISGAITLSIRSQHARRLAEAEKNEIKQHQIDEAQKVYEEEQRVKNMEQQKAKELLEQEEKRRKDDLELQERQMLASMELEKQKIQAQIDLELKKEEMRLKNEVKLEKIKNKQLTREMVRQNLGQLTINDANQRQLTQLPSFSRGYSGFVQYLNWLKDNDMKFNKSDAAIHMNCTNRTIERHVDAARSNGASELLNELSL